MSVCARLWFGGVVPGVPPVSSLHVVCALTTSHTPHSPLQVAQDASVPSPLNPLLEGGPTPEERQASFLELGLCLAAGMPDAALDPLFVVSRLPCC